MEHQVLRAFFDSFCNLMPKFYVVAVAILGLALLAAIFGNERVLRKEKWK